VSFSETVFGLGIRLGKVLMAGVPSGMLESVGLAGASAAMPFLRGE